MNIKSFSIELALFIIVLCISCNDDVKDNVVEEFDDVSLECIEENNTISISEIKQGLLSQDEQTVRITHNGFCNAIVRLSKPVMVTQAVDRVEWGYYQFPIIYWSGNSKSLIVKWQMKPDSHLAYGEEKYGYLISEDEGETWAELKNDEFIQERYRVQLSNGNILQVKDPVSKDISLYPHFPKPINEIPIKGYSFYYEKEVPNDFQGVYLEQWNNNHKSKIIHASISDPKLLRYDIDGDMPVVWWGNIKELPDGSLIAGVYPSYYTILDGAVSKSAVSFYRSDNKGNHWNILSSIPYNTNDNTISVFDGSEGFGEPAFEVLKDGTFVCVMRTGYTSPMYISYSSNQGKNWTNPEPFTPNGVMPNLLLLDNNVLVLASGRPGIQLRFNIDGDGKTWSEPIEMIQFEDENGSYDAWGTSCGYPSILKGLDGSFYLV